MLVGFPRGHPKIKMVLLRREDACCKIGEGTRRAVGLVEVNEDLAVRLLIGDQVTASGVGFVLGGWVPKADEEGAILLLVDVELILMVIKIKGEISLHREFRFFSGDVREIGLFGVFVGGVFCRDAKILIDVVPGAGGEGAP